jgi:hypothetical protein
MTMAEDVNDIPDPELIRRVIQYLSKKWDAVSTHFCLGSTYSMQLCRRFGFDPDARAA